MPGICAGMPAYARRLRRRPCCPALHRWHSTKQSLGKSSANVNDNDRPTNDYESSTASDRVSEQVYRVCCPNCRALLFMAREIWLLHVPLNDALVAIKCWRCRRVIHLKRE